MGVSRRYNLSFNPNNPRHAKIIDIIESAPKGLKSECLVTAILEGIAVTPQISKPMQPAPDVNIELPLEQPKPIAKPVVASNLDMSNVDVNDALGMFY